MIRALALLFLLAACQPGSEFPNGWLPKDARQCLQSGGSVVNGKAGPACAMPMPDAGAACTDGSSCAGGLCLAAGGGTCTAQTQNFGCIDVLEQGRKQTLCID